MNATIPLELPRGFAALGATNVVLLASLSPWVSSASARHVAAFAVTLVLASFVMDIVHQFQQRPHPSHPARRIAPL